MSTLTLEARARGCLLGLACGDAVGTSVEFSPRGSFAPLTDMVGGGPFQLQPGQWTDDTSMALCLAHSLLACRGIDAADQMRRYANWWQWGYCSATGECFDIGVTVSAALQRFLTTGDPYAGSTDPHTAGNGALMRLAPVVLYFWNPADAEAVLAPVRLSTLTTHGAPEAVACSRLLGEVLRRALAGQRGADLLPGADLVPDCPRVQRLAEGGFIDRPAAQIRGTGYCVDSLEAALWCCWHSASVEEAILMAANLGDDADTTAAIAGQIAGALHGVDAIPAAWRARLHQADEIDRLARELVRGKQGQEVRALPGGPAQAEQAGRDTVVLYRPTGPQEWALVLESGRTRWPPRLPDQPIFYPVTNERYASEIARGWNVPTSGCGYVTRFEVRRSFMDRYPVQQVGAAHHTEWWVPAQELATLNDNIVGLIDVIAEFRSREA